MQAFELLMYMELNLSTIIQSPFLMLYLDGFPLYSTSPIAHCYCFKICQIVAGLFAIEHFPAIFNMALKISLLVK